MSGMGGLNQAIYLLSRTQQLAAMLVICYLTWINSVKQICNYRLIASYNQLVSLLFKKEATFQNCGNILRAFSTTLLCESISNTRGNDLEHSNNEKDWIICSQTPKYDNASIWRRFRDYNGMGLRELAILNDNLRNSPYYL